MGQRWGITEGFGSKGLPVCLGIVGPIKIERKTGHIHVYLHPSIATPTIPSYPTSIPTHTRALRYEFLDLLDHISPQLPPSYTHTLPIVPPSYTHTLPIVPPSYTHTLPIVPPTIPPSSSPSRVPNPLATSHNLKHTNMINQYSPH